MVVKRDKIMQAIQLSKIMLPYLYKDLSEAARNKVFREPEAVKIRANNLANKWEGNKLEKEYHDKPIVEKTIEVRNELKPTLRHMRRSHVRKQQ